MPRPTRAQGRPGTPVIPRNFETSHAMVIRKTMTAHCVIRPPARTPRASDDLSYSTAATSPATYDGPCRVQALNADEVTKTLGDEETVRAAYRLILDRSADAVTRGSVATITEASDPTLTAAGQHLTVERVTRGSVTWERDVYVVDRQTTS